MANSGINLGKAYVQIMPSAKGITGSISKLLGGEAKSAGISSGFGFGGNLVSAASKVIAAAGIGKAFASSIRAGGALEQSIGGIETLFKGSADIVKGYAKNAYRDAQISANEYMEQATSFSASLLQSLGGDTKKASQTADMAIKDMADNSAKMGTNISSIQDAYQGFAKKNYTMLDNLKLGFGGTKGEMERLLAEAEKITGIKYDINNLDDVFNAIHVIQDELGIAGVAADEAKTTLEGSFNAMKASAQDFAGSLALGMDIKEPLTNLITTTGTFLFANLIPMVINIGKALPEALIQALSLAGPMMVSEGKKLMTSLGIGLSDSSPLNGIGDKLKANLMPVFESLKTSLGFLPDLFKSVSDSVMGVIEIIADGLTRLNFSGIASLASAIIPAITNAFQTFSSIVSPAIQLVVDSFVNLWNKIQPVLEIVAQALMPVFEIFASFLGGVFKGAMIAVSGTFDILAGIISFLTPIFQVLVNLVEFFSPALSKLSEWVGVAIGMFANFGSSGDSLKNILITAWKRISSAIKGAEIIIHGAISVITGIFNNLKSVGSSLKNSLQNAWSLITNAVSSSASSISGFVGKIKNVFNSLRNINLFDAGRAILQGFLNGLKSVWGAVQNFVGGIAGWIKAHKGPISYDKKLLIPAGTAIMDGLDRGLTDEFKEVKKTVTSMASDIYEGFKIDPKPVNLLAKGLNVDDDYLNKSISTNLDVNSLSSVENRDSKLDNMLSEILRLLQLLVDKDDDVYLDGERVSSILSTKIEEYRKRKELYENRRGGILLDV